MIRFPDLIRKHAFHTPEKIATRFEGRSHTWAQFSARVHGMAQALVDLEVAPGHRVAYLGLNSHWMAELYFVPSMIGAIFVPLNCRLSEAELIDVIDDCKPEVLIVDRHFQPQAAALMTQCAPLKTLIFADWDAPEGLADALIYDDLIVEGVANDAFDNRASQSDETMALFYTSGTTGVPKGVMLSHSNMLANALGTGPVYRYTAKDVLLICGPLFHVATGSRIFTSVFYGTTTVIQPKFQVEEFMALIQTNRITTMTMVPTMLQMILDHPKFSEFDFSSLRCITYGSAPMPIALIERCMDLIPEVTFSQGYGMTEAAPNLCVLPIEDHVPIDGAFPKLTSVGKPIAATDLRIAGPDGTLLPHGQTGEIIVRGPQIMNGYWNRPDETARVLQSGFYRTGDAGYVDEDGYVYLVGRTKEMIISGGENIYPIEIENCLSKHLAIAASAVIGVPDAKWGELVCAVVALKPGAQAVETDLIAHCRDQIAHYKSPKEIQIWPDGLPLNPANKIDKIKIKSMVLAARNR